MRSTCGRIGNFLLRPRQGFSGASAAARFRTIVSAASPHVTAELGVTKHSIAAASRAAGRALAVKGRATVTALAPPCGSPGVSFPEIERIPEFPLAEVTRAASNGRPVDSTRPVGPLLSLASLSQPSPEH